MIALAGIPRDVAVDSKRERPRFPPLRKSMPNGGTRFTATLLTATSPACSIEFNGGRLFASESERRKRGPCCHVAGNQQ